MEIDVVEIILGIGVAVAIVYTVFCISFMRNVQRLSNTFDNFLKNTESNLNQTLSEMKTALENIRNITGDIYAITSETKRLAHAISNVENDINKFSIYIRTILSRNVQANIAGIKAGIKAATLNVVKNLRERKKNDHE